MAGRQAAQTWREPARPGLGQELLVTHRYGEPWILSRRGEPETRDPGTVVRRGTPASVAAEALGSAIIVVGKHREGAAYLGLPSRERGSQD